MMCIKQAIEILNSRGFEVEDYSKIKWKVSDEDISELMKSDEDLIFFAEEQKREIENE
jgi:hypothetical protein